MTVRSSRPPASPCPAARPKGSAQATNLVRFRIVPGCGGVSTRPARSRPARDSSPPFRVHSMSPVVLLLATRATFTTAEEPPAPRGPVLAAAAVAPDPAPVDVALCSRLIAKFVDGARQLAAAWMDTAIPLGTPTNPTALHGPTGGFVQVRAAIAAGCCTDPGGALPGELRLQPPIPTLVPTLARPRLVSELEQAAVPAGGVHRRPARAARLHSGRREPPLSTPRR